MGSYEIVPAAPESFEAYVPAFASQDPLVSVTSPLVTMGPSIVEVTATGDLLAEKFAVSPSLRHSEGIGPTVWQVTEHKETGGDAVRVAFSTLNKDFFEVELPPSVAGELHQGDFVLDPELLARKRGFLGFGKAEVTFEPEPDQAPWSSDVFLPVLRVHRPRHRESSATISLTTSRSASVDASVQAAGMGGGGGVKWTTTLGSSYQAPQRCLEVGHPARIQIVWGRTLFNGTEISYGTRVTVTSVDTTQRIDRPIPTASDGCNRPMADVPAAQRLTEIVDKQQNKKGEVEVRSASLDSEVTGNVQVGLEVGRRLPFKLGLVLTRQLSESATLDTTLGPGGRYLGYTPSRRGTLELCWTTA